MDLSDVNARENGNMFDILKAKEELLSKGVGIEEIKGWFNNLYQPLGYECEHNLPATYLSDWLEYLQLQLKEKNNGKI